MVRLAGIVFFLLLAALAARAAEPQRELEGIKRKMQQERQGLTQARKKEGSVLDSLGKIDAALERRNVELKRVNAKLDALLSDIKDKEAEATKLDVSLTARREWLQRRVAALYRWRRAETPFVLLNDAPSVAELMQRRRYLAAMLARDQALVAELSGESERQKALARELEQKRIESGAQRRHLLTVQESIAAERQNKAVLLASLRREKEGHEKALKELEQAAVRLQKMIDELSRRSAALPPQAPSGAGFEVLKGKLDYPVHGTVAGGFGKTAHPEFSAELFRKGIDIDAPIGEQVRAVEAGRVVFADRFSGYGKMLIIDHGERYYTVYAHLAELFKKAGDPVRRGEAIAEVGDSDSLAGSRLYFEIRKDGKPLDPVPWFRKG